MNLFYTHDDAMKIQYDFECESQQAAKEGKSWIDYIYLDDLYGYDQNML